MHSLRSIAPRHRRNVTTSLRHAAAFTLVELLVVIGIIALLVSILLPALNKARQASSAIKCSANMRQIGQGIFLFAQLHGGRAPGQGAATTATPGSPKGIPWQTILSKEVFNYKNPNYIPWVALNGTFPYQQGVGKLYCPDCLQNMQTTSQFYRTYAMPLQLNGGYFGNKGYTSLITATGWGAQYPPEGVYGALLVPPQSLSVDSVYTAYYATGSKLSMFKNSAEKYMVVEEDRNDVLDSNGTGVNVMHDDALYPPYDTANGKISYRHNFKTNILYIDGHVELKAFDPHVRNNIYMFPY